MECLDLYQTQFRKPSLTVYCLDYSGSMEGIGREQMVEAMSQILIQENAEKNLLQASAHEVNILIPFEGYPRDVYTAEGNGAELEDLYDQVEAETATGGTDIYSAAMEGLRQLGNYDLSQYTPAIILLTDGVSDGSFSDFRDGYEVFGADVPVFSIMFGSADPTQLEELAELTHAQRQYQLPQLSFLHLSCTPSHCGRPRSGPPARRRPGRGSSPPTPPAGWDRRSQT